MTPEPITEYQQLSREIEGYTNLLKKRRLPGLVTTPAGSTSAKQQDLFVVHAVSGGTRTRDLAGMSMAGSRYFATLGKVRTSISHTNEHKREIAKIQKELSRLEYETVEEPGVIPRTLAVIEEILKRVNATEQPKLEKIIDSAGGNLENSRMILGGINVALNGVVNLALKYKTLVKIGLAIAAIGMVATIVLIPLLILRIILFGIT